MTTRKYLKVGKYIGLTVGGGEEARRRFFDQFITVMKSKLIRILMYGKREMESPKLRWEKWWVYANDSSSLESEVPPQSILWRRRRPLLRPLGMEWYVFNI